MTLTALKQPEVQDALVVTLNRMGYMLHAPEKYNQAFIDFSANDILGPVLEIGAAYGVSTLRALERGAYIIANDLDERHLQILKSTAPQHHQNRLGLKPGRMPNEVNFEEKSFKAILASRVLNFVQPEELDLCFEKIFKWLKPGGKFFVLVSTPYMGTYHKLLPVYQKRKAEGHPHPGLIDDIPSCTTTRAPDLPQFINLIDEDMLGHHLLTAGFEIEDMEFSPALEEHPEDMKFDGREQLGAIAVKK